MYCVITEWNYTELHEFVKYFDQLSLHHIGFMHQNFITKDVTQNHNLSYGSWLPATHSNIEETDFSKIDLNSIDIPIVPIKMYRNTVPILEAP